MIIGAHVLIYTRDAEGARAFFRDVLGLPGVDAGRGWLIFALPPAEMAAHPADGEGYHELYLMCDDVHKTVRELEGKGAEFTSPIKDQGWGLVTSLKLPGGEEMGLYQPKHPMAIKAPKPRARPKKAPVARKKARAPKKGARRSGKRR